MRKITVFLLSFCFVLAAQAQIGHYIGLHKNEVIDLMKTNMPEMTQARVVNPNFNYLKYQDDMGEQTILFFLDDMDVCTGHRFMSHYISLGSEVIRLNRAYNKVDDETWAYEHEGEKYIVELKKEQWFFSLSTKIDN